MEDTLKSWSEISRIVSVLNGEQDEVETDEFKKGDVAKAKAGTKSAVVRVRKALQTIKGLTKTARDEAQELKA